MISVRTKTDSWRWSIAATSTTYDGIIIINQRLQRQKGNTRQSHRLYHREHDVNYVKNYSFKKDTKKDRTKSIVSSRATNGRGTANKIQIITARSCRVKDKIIKDKVHF